MGLFDKIKKRRSEQATADQAAPDSVEAVTEGGAELHAELAFDQALRVSSYEQIPPHLSVLTAPNGPLPVPENQHRDVALLELDDAQAALLCMPSYYGSTRFFSMLDRAQRAGLTVARLIVAEDPGVLLILYSKHMRLSDAIAQDFDGNSESARLFEDIITRAVQERATDVHLMVREETGTIAYRIDGVITRSRRLPSSLINEAAGFAYTKMAEESSRSHPAYNFRVAQSCSIPMRNVEGKNLKLRYQSLNVTGGFDIVLRLLYTDETAGSTKSLADLGYAPTQQKLLSLASRKAVGAVFIAGVTGSGKTTTLKTLMTEGTARLLLKSYAVEDPSEYKMYGVSQISVQRDATSQSAEHNPFIGAMRTVMRADPDIIMVGEVRDRESGSLVKTMIQSGHKVYTTVHASSGIEIIERLTSDEIGLSRQTLSAKNFVNAFVYQRLLRLTCQHCGVPAKENLDADMQALITKKFGISLDGVRLIHPAGCERCKGRGYQGQTVASEIIVPDTKMLRFIREGADLEAEEYWRATRTAAFDEADCTGKTAFEHALYKMSQGLIDPLVIEDGFEPFETYQIQELRT